MHRIKILKNQQKLHHLCKKMKCEFLSDIAEKVQSLKFDEKPNYGMLRHLFARNLMNVNMVPNNEFDWNKSRNDRINDDIIY